MRSPRLLILVLLLAGCGGEDSGPERDAALQREAAQPAPPPDAGTQTGHGADPTRVRVPRDDSTPPAAAIVLESTDGRELAEASQPPGGQSHGTTRLREPRLTGTVRGRDADGGVARVRVSLKELVTCRAPDGSTSLQPRTRYFPPPQIERIRSNPAALLPTEKTRTLPLTVGSGACADPRAVEGELWGEAINGTGLEAVTPHLHFRWTR